MTFCLDAAIHLRRVRLSVRQGIEITWRSAWGICRITSNCAPTSGTTWP